MTASNIVFIDIDGPLLPNRMWAASDNIRLLDQRVIDRSPHLRFDPGCVGLVVRLCRLAKARLVLASNWRRTWAHGQEALRAKLAGEGLTDDLWHDDWALPVLVGDRGNKACEIERWLDANPIERAVLIDNDPIAAPAPVQLIRIDAEEGFGLSAYRLALQCFGATDPRDRPARAM